MPEATGPELSADAWHISNNLIDFILPFIYCVFWFAVLFVIETDLVKRALHKLNLGRRQSSIDQ